jgi:hypothetical protein
MANRYWRGGAGTWDTTTTTNWSATSGGAGGASVPTSADDVFFDQVATYTVSCSTNGLQACRSITVSAGIVTFSTAQSGSNYFNCYGSISMIAATLFTAPTFGFGAINHIPNTGGAISVAFGSSGANTATVSFTGIPSSCTTYTWCNAATQTFNGVNISVANFGLFTCAGSTITINNLASNASGQYDSIDIRANTVSVAATTINMGTADARTDWNAGFTFLITGGTAPTLTTFNVIQVRAYYSYIYNVLWTDTSVGQLKSIKLGNLTFKGLVATSGSPQFVTGISGSNTFTATDTSINFFTNFYGPAASAKVFSGAFTLNGSTFNPDLSTSISFQSTTTLTTGTGGTNGSVLDILTNNNSIGVTFTGAVSMTGGSSTASQLQVAGSTTFSSTLTSTAPTGIRNKIVGKNAQSLNISGNSSLTNTDVEGSGTYANWEQAGASTLTVTTSPTSSTSNFTVYKLSAVTGAMSFTSTNISLLEPNGISFNALSSSGLVSVTGVNTPAGVTFTTSTASVSFVAASLATWTDVYIQVLGNFTVTGAGGFTLAGTTKNSGLNVNGAWGVTGPTTLNASLNSDLTVDAVTAGGGAFTVNAPAGTTGRFLVSGSFTTTSVFSSTFSSTNLGVQISGNTALTFTGAISITDPNKIDIQGGTVTISSGFAVTSTTLIDGVDLFYSPQFKVQGNTAINTSSTVAAWTFTNARILFKATFSSDITISNPVSLVNNGGLYSDTALILNGALTSSGASRFNIMTAPSIQMNNSVSLVNCQLTSETITVAGGATKNFSYSLSTPIPNNTTIPGVAKEANYPQINCNFFTVTNGGGSFSITGGGSAIYRTLVGGYSGSSTAPNCAFSLPSGLTSLTLTDVDFWRVTVSGAVTKPLTGTRLGNVGTISGVTTATPKTVYWVGGSGAWDGAKWGLTSGSGSPSAANYPLPQDTVVFDANSGTGNFTYPATVRVGTLDIQNVPAGTSAVYCNSSTITANNAPAYFWVSGSINGPASTPTGTFILGNTSTDTYNSFATGYTAQSLVIADSSASDTHTINPINLQFMRYGSLQFASIGTTTISSSITEPLWYINNYCNTDAYTINITAAQIGSSSYNYEYQGRIAIGYIVQLASYGAANYGSCSIYTGTFYPSTTTPNTAYSAYIGALYAQDCTTLGNINFTQGLTSTTSYYFFVNQATSLLNLNITSRSNTGSTTLYITHSGSAPRNISMYSLTATYSGSVTTMAISRQSGSSPTFVKLGGGSVGVTGVNVTNINASPANTWYTTGTITTSTGWNAGAAPNSKGGFLLFQ